MSMWRALKVCFLYIGTIIGAGFASGREIALFFGETAPLNVALSAVFMAVLEMLFLVAGKRSARQHGYTHGRIHRGVFIRRGNAGGRRLCALLAYGREVVGNNNRSARGRAGCRRHRKNKARQHLAHTSAHRAFACSLHPQRLACFPRGFFFRKTAPLLRTGRSARRYRHFPRRQKTEQKRNSCHLHYERVVYRRGAVCAPKHSFK